ncbi:MAG: hypothetical protein R3E01_13690 [Pirellulaceae bacterium]|nr:hypothetical protein [Planctomycetales bacterium]
MLYRIASALLLAMISLLFANSELCAAQLQSFESTEGGFQISFPGAPQESESEIPNTDGIRTLQKQYVVGTADGAYIASYQDNPNLKSASAERVNQAYTAAGAGLKKAFGGDIKSETKVKLGDNIEGREFVVPIPAAGGVARCRLFLVGTRLYQIMAVGKPDFVDADQTTKVMESFALLELAKRNTNNDTPK